MEDLLMGGTSPASSSESFMPPEYVIGVALFDAAADPQTEESEQSVDDSGPSTPIHNSNLFEDDYCIRIIKPYAIEEPDDEPDCTITRLNIPCLPDRFERWQRDLADYMDDLNYQPDELDLDSRPTQKEGQKRKTAHITGATQNCYPHMKQRHTSAKTQPQMRGNCTKRRKFSKQPHGVSQMMNSFAGYRAADANESSSRETRSASLSASDTMNNSLRTEEMDIE
jgi:hypothetical protein